MRADMNVCDCFYMKLDEIELRIINIMTNITTPQIAHYKLVIMFIMRLYEWRVIAVYGQAGTLHMTFGPPPPQLTPLQLPFVIVHEDPLPPDRLAYRNVPAFS